MEREGDRRPQRAFVIALPLSSDAERECEALLKRTKRVIKLITVQEILDEQFAQKM